MHAIAAAVASDTGYADHTLPGFMTPLDVLLLSVGTVAVIAVVPALIALAAKRPRRRDSAVRPPEWHPPGWYPSPTGTGCLQWWDGTRWTDSYTSGPPVFPDTGTPAR